MRSGKAAYETRQGFSAAAPAIVMALLLFGLLLWQASGADSAFAADDGSNSLVTTQSSDIHGDVAFSTCVVKTKSVTKSYAAKQKLAITMAGHDTTIVKLGNVSKKAKWTTSNSKIAKVKSTGTSTAEITAVAPGKATIKAASGNKTLTCSITVTGSLAKTKSLTPLQADQKLVLKSLKGLKAKSWKSSNKDCVTVDKKGKLTPKATGRSVITCTDSGKNKYTCVVSVKCPKITCAVKGSAKVDIPGAKTYYYKRFQIVNKCGQDIALDKGNISFYSSSGTAHEQLQAYDAGLQKPLPLSQSPLTVAHKQTVTFATVGEQACPLTDVSHFCLKFTANGVCYRGDFSASTGTMLRCTRA